FRGILPILTMRLLRRQGWVSTTLIVAGSRFTLIERAIVGRKIGQSELLSLWNRSVGVRSFERNRS
ncbi:MAG: hypothetical protein JJU36_16330, partial [Phycisphaeraceae bacterium]|nr:hypothetical protein [Phycisphaeraceae bacterium]